jgi:4-amino-4-deoxy-L-arabinose transferase-like glycosyltransferase
MRRLARVIPFVAIAHAGVFLRYQQPDWATQWTDQDGYRRLGEILAATGRFTRYLNTSTYVPEVLRTPGYPAFVAIMYKLFGVSQLAVVIPQALLCGLLTIVVYRLALFVGSERLASYAALAVALYSPIPYFAALVLTELWTTFVLTVGMWLVLRAARRDHWSDYLGAGVVLGLTALCRPAFVLLPVCIAMVGASVSIFESHSGAQRATGWLVLLAAAALTCLPWFGYNYYYFHRLTISPAGGVGRATWEGSWQDVWRGRTLAELTALADRYADRAQLDAKVMRLAGVSRAPAAPMLDYVHQWQDIRRIWTSPVDPAERARARVRADQEYWRVGVHNIRTDPAAWLRRRVAVGQFVLWATDVPFRYSDINRVRPLIIYAIWAADAGLAVLAFIGLAWLLRVGFVRESALLATPLAYVSLVHFPLLTEVRLSLPAKPVMLVLAVTGASALAWLSGAQNADQRSPKATYALSDPLRPASSE